jgi:dTDP-4-dehydrorhamnose reductase
MTSDKYRILLTGSKGQIGNAILKNLHSNPVFDCFHFDRLQLDISREDQIKNIIKDIKPHYFINTAAYTAVDAAESDAENCMVINGHACGWIAEALKKHHGRLIHFSSDYVYHSYTGFPLKESDLTRPAGVYAKSKLMGENLIREAGIPAMILRTSWVCSPDGKNFLNTILRLSEQRPTLQIVNDQYGAPAFASDIAHETHRIMEAHAKGLISEHEFNDTYNFTSHGCITWYDFAVKICQLAGKTVEIAPIPSKSYPTPAQRPYWSVMSLNKIKTKLNARPPHWLEALKACLREKSL